MGLTLALTGGTGFIGRHLLGQPLLSGGSSGLSTVRLLHRRDVEEHPHIRPVRGSMEDETALRRLVDGADVVVHMAGSIQARTRADFERDNVEATARLARLAEQGGARRFMLVSSLAATVPQASNYAWSKAEGEKAARSELRSCSLEILRPPAIYGPGDRMTLAIFKQMASGVLLVPRGGMSSFALLHVHDLVALISTLILSPQEQDIVEPDDGKAGGYRWEDLADIGKVVAGRPVRVARLPRWVFSVAAVMCDGLSSFTNAVLPLSRDKLGELCHSRWVGRGDRPSGWRPQVDFVEGARETLQWYRQAGWI